MDTRQIAERALREIAEHPHCSYDHPSNGTPHSRDYGIGCADGHRCAAQVAKRALAQLAVSPPSGEQTGGCSCAPDRTQRGWRDPHCPTHGEFPIQPSAEAAPATCPLCQGRARLGDDVCYNCEGAGTVSAAVPLAPTPPETLKAITFPPEVTAKLLANARAVHAGKLRAAADWFTDCKTLTLEQLPVGFIEALKAGADALESSPSPGAVETPEFCICAAVRLDDGRVIRGHRHHNCFPAAKEAGQEDLIRQDMQGFVTSTGRYVDRAEGLRLQMAAGIPSARGAYNGHSLFSEDLY